MSSAANSSTSEGRAEQAFREAFIRLKANNPTRLGKGFRISQNNVAKEAGCDPSALKKARYPGLVAEIQAWVCAHPDPAGNSRAEAVAKQRDKNRTQKMKTSEVAAQRDHALSLLVEADAKILALITENNRLRAMLPQSNVIDFPFS